jgi:hypothetical protein
LRYNFAEAPIHQQKRKNMLNVRIRKEMSERNVEGTHQNPTRSAQRPRKMEREMTFSSSPAPPLPPTSSSAPTSVSLSFCHRYPRHPPHRCVVVILGSLALILMWVTESKDVGTPMASASKSGISSVVNNTLPCLISCYDCPFPIISSLLSP